MSETLNRVKDILKIHCPIDGMSTFPIGVRAALYSLCGEHESLLTAKAELMVEQEARLSDAMEYANAVRKLASLLASAEADLAEMERSRDLWKNRTADKAAQLRGVQTNPYGSMLIGGGLVSI